VKTSETFLTKTLYVPWILAKKEWSNHFVQYIDSNIGTIWRCLTDTFGSLVSDYADDGLLRRKVRFDPGDSHP
jgi:hypothetical protein